MELRLSCTNPSILFHISSNHPGKRAIIDHNRACIGPMLLASDSVRPGSGTWWHVYRELFLFAAARAAPVAPALAPPGGPMEIAFSFDTTGSMNSYLQGVRNHLQDIVTRLFADIPTLRISIMAHGDYCDSRNYVTKHVDLTNDVVKLTNFVKNVKSTGGGDWEECYELVLRQMQTHVNWAPGTQRALVMIGDAIPHEKTYAQNKLKIDWKKEVVALRNMVSHPVGS